MKKILLLNVFFLSIFTAFGQVTKTDATGATLDAAIATRNFTFTSGEFGGCSSLIEVEVDLTLSVTDNAGCVIGGYGVHNDIAVSLTSPSGTTVHLVHDFTGILLGFPPPLITYNDAGYPSIVNQTATYDDDAALLADNQSSFGAGTWRPQNPLSAFDGEDPAGTWVLRVADGRNQFGADYTCYINSAVRITCGLPCTDPTVPTLTQTPATVCTGGTASLNISGTLNDATAWHVYTGSCGGTQIGTTTTGTFAIPGTINTPTTYFVRGEGGCVTPGTCGTITITPTALDNASFNYGAAAYCVSASDPTPTITGLAGGTFSSGAGLVINASTGAIDVSASTPGTYTVTYTTSGTCPNSSNVSVTINALDNPGFNYSAASFCANAADPTPTITGQAGGTFSSGAGLAINASTGTIDVSASTPGTYTVTYTTSGTCPNSSNVSVTVNSADNASFNYGAAAYCVNDSDPTPTITGLAGGTFSSGAGLSINAGTGLIDVSASTPGTYTVTYTTSGTCPNSSNVSVTINALDNPGFNYSAASFCVNAADPTPTMTGLAGGSFSSTAGLSINTSTGTIDVSASTPGTYTVTYTTSGTCPNSSNVSVTINALDNASFNYGAAAYCMNDSDPTPTITGLAGGTFSSGAGLAINAGTGLIDVSASTPGTYTVTYTTAGSCPNSSNVSVTINALDNTSFNYSAAAYCVNDSDPTPTITGLAGGTFSSGAGLSINAGTGLIDVSVSTPGTYTVTYTTSGTCPNSSNVSVTINALDDASFSYSASTYCPSASDPTPTITGLAGGTFTSGAGLAINTSTGTIDISASTPGNYTVTYTTAGSCPNSSNISVAIADAVPPVATCPGNQTETASVTCDFALPDYTSLVTATDNCTASPTVTQSPLAGTVINANTTITMTVDDGNGNTSTCTFDVILDFSACQGAECTNAIALAPMAPCGDTQVESGSTVGGTPSTEAFCGTSLGTGGANWYTFTGDGSDWTVSTLGGGTNYDSKLWVYEGTCGSLSCVTGNDDFGGTAQSQVSFATTMGSTYYVVVGGFSSNEGNYDVTFTSVETTAPVADIAVLSDINEVCEVTSLTAPTATDNCSAVTVTNNATLPITTSSTITWTYTDASGNSSTQTQNVVLNDAIAPTASNPDTLYFECIADAIIDETVVDDEADNCSGPITVSFVADVVTGNGCQDTITRTYNVEDESGNSIDVTQIIIIEDLTAPTASNPLTLVVQCSADVPAPSVGWVTDEADNCSTPTVAWVADVSDGLSCPETITRTFSVTDACGNSIEVDQLIVVNDLEVPVVDVAVLNEEVGFCDVTPATPTATDNCAGVINGVADVTFPINTLGTTTVTWTFTDSCGNSTSQTQEVTIEQINVNTTFASDGITIVSSNNTPGVTYQWLDCNADTLLTGETNKNFTPVYSSDFAVIVTQDGCSDTSACVTITEVSIDELKFETFTMYPNPTQTGMFTINIDAELKDVSVIDMLGRAVIVGTDLETKTIDGSGLMNGAYIVRITTQNDQQMVGTITVQQ